MDEQFSFAYFEYYQTPKQQKLIQKNQEEQDVNQEVVNTSIFQASKKIKSKYLQFSGDSLVDRIQEHGSLNQIKLLKFKVSNQLQFNVISDSFDSLANTQSLQINFVDEWYLEILSAYTAQRYWYYDPDRIDRVEDEESNFAQEFKKLINLTHLEINFKNMIFSQVLGDFAKVIQNYKQLSFLSLNIPPLFTFMDEITSSRILKGLSGLDNLKEYRIKFGNISKRDSEFIKTMAESIVNQTNLEILNLQLNTEITEDVAHKFVEVICNLKKLTSLDFFAQNIQTKKSLNQIFKPIYNHETLQNVSLNIEQKDCFNIIQNMSVMPQIQNFHILFSNQKKLDVQNTLFNVSLIQKLVGLHLEFNDNLKLKPNTLSELGRSLVQLNQVKDLQLKFGSYNQISTQQMSFLLDSLSAFSELRKFSFYVGKGNILNAENLLKIAQILNFMRKLNKLSLSIIETQFIDINCIKQIYQSVSQLDSIQNLFIDIKNINSLIFLNLINIFPQLDAQSFQINNISLSFQRSQITNQQQISDDSQQIFQDFYLSLSDKLMTGDYDVKSFSLFKQINSVSLNIPSNQQLIADLFGSFSGVKQIQKFKLIIEDTIFDEEMNKISSAISQMQSIKKLNLQIKKANVNLQAYQNFVKALCNLNELEELNFYVPINEIDDLATIYLFSNLKQFQNLEQVSINLGQLDSIKNCACSFDQNISQFCRSKILQIRANLILNNETAFKTAEVVKHLKSIQIAKFKSIIQSYYELKLFLEKGVKHMIGLRHFEMVNNIKVDQSRIKKQKSNIFRKAIRLVNLNIT
ncbi:hypothetical protein ABPG74_006582 [Tetrahymena malaccensis]